jgi:2-methylcitrate dehydratase PrpD
LITQTLAEFIAGTLDRPLPKDVEHTAALHTLDTVAAMVSGSKLNAGTKIIPFVAALGGPAEACVIGSRIVTGAVNAALANGMTAHGDETDDSHAASLTHPGCAIVPAALAVAERERRSGRDLIRAVSTGYDVGARVSLALGAGRFFDRHHDSHAFGGVFGATAAAAALYRVDAAQAAHALAYAVHLAAGNTCWRRDPDHVEKAFVFGGMPAQHGVLAASFAAAGFRGSPFAIEDSPGLLSAFPENAQASLATEELGTRFEVMRTSIKKWSVGSPIQSALGGLSELIEAHRFAAADVAAIVVSLPRRRAEVVQNPDTPDLNLPQQLALLLADGEATFSSSHDHARMHDPRLVALRALIRVEPRDGGDPSGLAYVTVRLKDGRTFERQSVNVRGTPKNPMTTEEVSAKARDLIKSVLGESVSEALIAKLLAYECVKDVCELRPLLQTRVA